MQVPFKSSSMPPRGLTFPAGRSALSAGAHLVTGAGQIHKADHNVYTTVWLGSLGIELARAPREVY